MIKMLDIFEIDNIMEIWIAENINSHSFISKNIGKKIMNM